MSSLYDALQKSAISVIFKMLSLTDSLAGRVYQNRVKLLQLLAWIPFLPTAVRDWLPWINSQPFKFDFLAYTLHSASELNIFFHLNLTLLILILKMVRFP